MSRSPAVSELSKPTSDIQFTPSSVIMLPSPSQISRAPTLVDWLLPITVLSRVSGLLFEIPPPLAGEFAPLDLLLAIVQCSSVSNVPKLKMPPPDTLV